MVTAPAPPPVSTCFTGTDVEPFIILDKLTPGSPQLNNVIYGENPYMRKPEDLPPGIFFLIDSNESIKNEHGRWETKGTCEVFSNQDFIGWKKTLEYYEGHYPCERKTKWVMQVFSTTQKILSDENKRKEASSLCRVFGVSGHETQQNVSSTSIDAESRYYLPQFPAPDANCSTSIGSSRNPEVNRHDETEVLAVAERHAVPEHHGDRIHDDFLELNDLANPASSSLSSDNSSQIVASELTNASKLVNVPAERHAAPEHHGENMEIDIFSREHIYNLPGDNFLEMDDLDNPASSSSSSKASSVFSFSSDERLNTVDFLNELDQDQASEQTNASRLVNVPATDNSEEMVIAPATLGSLVSVDGSDESLKIADSTPISALGTKVTTQPKKDQKDEGSSSSSSDNAVVASRGRKRVGFGGLKNLLLCFLPS